MGPFIREKTDTKKMMMHLLIALTPIILFTFIKNGIIPYKKGATNFLGMLYPLIFISLSALTTYIFETIFKIIKERNIKKALENTYAIFPGLFLGLILPINTPIYVMILGSFIASIIAKMLFGGFGKNIFNPALLGYLIIMLIFSGVIAQNGGSLNKYEIDTITYSTPLTNAQVNGVANYETLIKPYGNMTNIIIGNIPGAIGETSKILCILAFIYLVYFKVIKWRITLTYILTVFAITYAIGGTNNLGIWYPLFQILTGGLIFGAVFMATDPVTSPVTQIGQIIYGIALGILTVIFRFLTPYPEGVMISILIMNPFARLLDKIGSLARFNFKITLIPFIIEWILIIIVSLIISIKYEKTEIDSNYNILSKKVEGEKVTYIVTQKGYSSILKSKIIIENNKILELDVLEHNDSFYENVEKENYIEKLKENPEIDTISGATITSNALKTMIKNTLNDYKFEKRENINSETKEEVKQKDFEIINKTQIDEVTTVYEITNKGFSGK
jgi:electron transport complex protein RnfD